MNSRSLKRQAAKEEYKKFCKRWSEICKEQNKRSATMSRFDLPKGVVEEIEKAGGKILGKKPTFNQWYASVKNVPQYEAEPELVQEHIEENLSWDED